MIQHSFYIDKYDWFVHSFFAVTHYDTEKIMDRLCQIGCDERSLRRAYKNLSSGKLNTGLTYSNNRSRASVVVIALTSSAHEFVNSFVHETDHLCRHIGKYMGMSPNEEEVSYLCGDVAELMFKKCHHLLCDRCRD